MKRAGTVWSRQNEEAVVIAAYARKMMILGLLVLVSSPNTASAESVDTGNWWSVRVKNRQTKVFARPSSLA